MEEKLAAIQLEFMERFTEFTERDEVSPEELNDLEAEKAQRVIEAIVEGSTKLSFDEWDRLAVAWMGAMFRPYFLAASQHLLTINDFYRGLLRAWTESSYAPVWQDDLGDQLYWLRGDRGAGSRVLSDAVDGDLWMTRPAEPITLYRGATPDGAIGSSWTTDLAVAEVFAAGLRGYRPGAVYVATIDPTYLLMYIEQRQESEWVVDLSAFDSNPPKTFWPAH